jgi:deoxyadenosine/deoxycytidine kinase
MIDVVVLEGPIAAGKSTALEHIEDCNLPGVVVVREPVDNWQGASMLQAMYDGTLPMCTFQVAALATRVAALHKALAAEPPPVMIVAERSVYTDRLFAMANLDSASVAASAYDVAWRAMVPLLPVHTVFHIMLQCPTPTLMQRVAARGRPEEAQITTDYMDTINTLHDAWAVSAPACNIVDASRGAVAVAASVAAIVIERRGSL